MRRHLSGLLIFTSALLQLLPAGAEPIITSPPPANGVSPAAPLVFTFSEAMNPTFTAVEFVDFTTFTSLSTTAVWSGGDKVLTCTPSPVFPANRTIIWSAYGENLEGEPLGGIPGGIFTTGNGSGVGGSGTNSTTTFSVGKTHHYNQTSGGSPTLDPATPYGFSGVTALASNRTATDVVLTLPTGSVSNLTQLPLQPELFVLYGIGTSLSTYDATFPAGAYSFQVKASSSNQTVVVNLPPASSLAQPGPPHLTNYSAAQAVNPSQPFTLGWDAYVGGTAADYIDVDIGNVYNSPDPGLPGALPGTARTFTIPAGSLRPNSNYLSRVGFFHHVGATNASYTTAAFRATYTEFSLITTGSSELVLTNPSWTPGVFSFDVDCTIGQTVTVEFTNRFATGAWPRLLTTNCTSTRIHIVAPQTGSFDSLFFRARNGP